METTVSRWRTRTEKLRSFPPVDIAQLVVLGVVLAGVEVALRCTRVDRVARRLGVSFLDGAPSVGRTGRLALSRAERRWVNNAGRVVRRWPFDASCLRRSLLLGWVLRRRAPVLVLGVRHEAGSVVAHAWLRVDGVDLDAEAGNYLPFGDAATPAIVSAR